MTRARGPKPVPSVYVLHGRTIDLTACFPDGENPHTGKPHHKLEFYLDAEWRFVHVPTTVIDRDFLGYGRYVVRATRGDLGLLKVP